MDEDTFLQTIENSYKETDDGEFSTLSVLLTPMDLLKSDERFARAKLYQIDSGETELSIIHDRFNENDNKALEVYYDKTFIGYIRKRFTNEYIDYAERVDEFCFHDNKLRDLQIFWTGTDFIVKGISFVKIQKLKEEKESLLKDIRQYRDIMFGQNLKSVSIELQDDKELVLAYVGIIGNELEYASERLKNDKEVVITALKTRINARVVMYASNELKNDPEIIWLASKKKSNGFKYAGKELLSDKSFILTTLEKGMSWVFKYADKKLRSDEEVATRAISQTKSNIEYCSKDLQNNTKFMLMAIKKSGDALQYADNKLQNDKEVVMIAVNNCGSALEYASEWLKDEEEVVLAALSNDGNSLEYVSKRLQDNKKVVLSALANTGGAFEYASQRLRNDAEVLLTAVSNVDLEYWDTIYYMFDKTTNDTLKDKSFLLNAIKNNIPVLDILREYHNGLYEGMWSNEIDDKDIILMAHQIADVRNNQLDYASTELLSNKNFVLEIINIGKNNQYSDNCVLEYLESELRNDIDVVSAAIKKNGLELKYASEELKNNKDLVQEALNINFRALQYASEELKNNKDLFLSIPGSNIRRTAWGDSILSYVSGKLKNDKDVVIDAIKKDGIHSLQYASEEIKNNKEVILIAVKNYGCAIEYASEELKNDKEVVLAALEESKSAIKYVDTDLKYDSDIQAIING